MPLRVSSSQVQGKGARESSRGLTQRTHLCGSAGNDEGLLLQAPDRPGLLCHHSPGMAQAARSHRWHYRLQTMREV